MKTEKKAFTLIELLVVVSIIALLVSILLPALGKAREHAKQVVCSTHLNQIGAAINLYMAEKSSGRYPQQRSPLGTWSSANEKVGHWWQQVVPYINNEFQSPNPNAARATVGNCPNHTTKDKVSTTGYVTTNNQYSYVGNSNLITDWFTSKQPAVQAGTVKLPSEKVIVYECHTNSWMPYIGVWWGGWLKYPFYYQTGVGNENQTHGQVSNFLFCDNHVASMHGDKVKDREQHWSVK